MLAQVVESFVGAGHPFHGWVVTHEDAHPLDTDMHSSFEVGILLAGEQDRHFEDTVLHLRPGDVWLLAGWEPHGWESLVAGTTELVLAFTPEFLGEEEFESMSWLELFATPPAERPRVNTEALREDVLCIAQKLRHEIEDRSWGWLSLVRLSLLELLLKISREWKSVTGGQRPYRVQFSNLARILPAVELLHSKRPHRVTREQAAAACNLSVSQFSTIFRRTMGLSFGQFERRNRLARAAQLLLTTDIPVEEIANELGFSDGSHLNNAFLRHYGHSPRQHRRQRWRRGPRQ